MEAAANAELSPISGKARGNLAQFGKMIQRLGQRRKDLNVTEMMQAILDDSGYLGTLRAANTLEAETRVENLEELLSVTQGFDARYQPENEDSDIFVDFLAELALLSAIGLRRDHPSKTKVIFDQCLCPDVVWSASK